jgi:hypothetical protein
MSYFSSALRRPGGRPLEGLRMQKVDPAFLFELGDKLRELRALNAASDLAQVWLVLNQTSEAIEQAVVGSIYTHLLHDPCRVAANALVALAKRLQEEIMDRDWATAHLEAWEAQHLQTSYTKFETLFLGDLQTGALYLVSPKGGFDTTALIEAGLLLFSGALATKVSEAVADVRAATRCIAFELPTAAGFHLHRAHEAVLRVYWDNVTGGRPRPKQQNMGVYLNQLEKLGKGKKAVRAHLQSIKDFHRNPLMHPEQSLDLEQALDLLAAIRSSIGYMLQAIPIGSYAPLLEAAEQMAALADGRETPVIS